MGTQRIPGDRLIFISHKHSDQPIASLLTDFLLLSLNIKETELRCTSVPGHQLPFGTTIEQTLKQDLNKNAAVIALLTRGSIRSSWVIFELGACWALGKVFVPILGPRVTPQDLPGPLAQYPCISIAAKDARSRLIDAVNQIAQALRLAVGYSGKSDAKLDQLLATFGSWHEDSRTPELDEAKAFEISWSVMTLLAGAPHPAAVRQRMECYLDDLGIKLPKPVSSYMPASDTSRPSTDDEGRLAMEFMEIVGGQLSARQPRLVAFFEAGFNMILDMQRNNGARLGEILTGLNLPPELRGPASDLLGRANKIHEHFELRLKGQRP